MRNNVMGSFIRGQDSIDSMAKDSDLIKEVESFLKEHKVDSYIMKYDRGIDFTEHKTHPAFDIQTNALKALRGLSKELNIDFKKDIYRRHRYLEIENKDYRIYLYVPLRG